MIGLLRNAAMSAAAAVVAVCAMAAPAAAVVVDFEDLTGSGTLADGYGGINWNGAWTYYDTPETPHYNAHSGDVRIYAPGGTASFEFVSDSIFVGAWINGFDFAGPIYFELFLDGNLVHTSATLDLPPAVPEIDANTFLASGYGGLVDQVTAYSIDSYWVMDDVTFTLAEVPEPGSMALLGGGLLGAALMRRRTPRR